MKSHLIALSIGPVQDFIAAARRTRDLWFGSHMLSEIAKAAALAVHNAGGELIFPHPGSREKLSPETDFTVANIILAETNDPQTVRENAEKAARESWLSFAHEAREKAGDMVREEVWKEQLGDVVEFYSAWTPVSPERYKAARERVMRLLAARKNCRNFSPFTGKAGLPKSSLDGLRETVLKENARSRGPLRIKPGESLCAVGVTKRVSGEGRFPSVSRVASDPWLRGLLTHQKGRESLEKMKQHCEKLVQSGALSRISIKNGLFNEFPYEGTPLYIDRHNSVEKEAPAGSGVSEILQEIRKELESLFPSFGVPSPYFSVLCADGDRMGKAISRATSPDEHRNLSSALSAFASNARVIVEKNRGVCVYTGGDDVLAFLPCDTALSCARALHDDFGKNLEGVSKSVKEGDKPTLSVGISVGHALEDLADLLDWGREAERRAKADGKPAERDGLSVIVRSRGGADQFVRERWGRLEGDGVLLPLDQRLLFWAEAYSRKALPSKFGYEVRSTATFYKHWTDGLSCARALKMDLDRIFARKDVSLSEDERKIAEKSISAGITDAEDLERLADELIIGQWFSESIRQAKGGKPRASDDNAA